MYVVWVVEWKDDLGELQNRWFTYREVAEDWAKEYNGTVYEKDVS